MSIPQLDQLRAAAERGEISRRDVLTTGLRLGLSSAAILSLMAVAREASAAPSGAVNPRALRPQEGQPTGTFTMIRDGGAPDLDPHSAYDNAAAAILLGCYDMLIQFKGESTTEYEPMLATSWEASPDNSTFTFTIPAGVTFHSGDPCTAQTVKDSFTRFLEMGLGPVNVISRFVSDAGQIEVVDDVTVRFNLGRPQPLFLSAMASSYGPFVVNPAAVDANKTDDDPFAHEWMLNNADGTGPYQLVENSVNEQVILTKFEGYHGGWDRPHFEELVVRIVPESATRRQLIENGEADATVENLNPEDYAALEANPDVTVLSLPSTAVYWVMMNAPRLKAPAARQGFSYAFPYDDVVAGAYGGRIARSGPVASTVRGYDPDVFLYPTDLVKAKELILSAGFAEGDSFDYLFIGSEAIERSIAQLFQANVAEMGFNLELTEIDRPAFLELVYGSSPAEERPMFMGGWGWWPDYNDPWNQLYPNFATASISPNGSNGGYYSNARLDEILAEAAQYETEEQLTELMREAQNILTEQDPPVIYHGERQWTYVLRNDVQGFGFNPLYLSAYPFRTMSRATA